MQIHEQLTNDINVYVRRAPGQKEPVRGTRSRPVTRELYRTSGRNNPSVVPRSYLRYVPFPVMCHGLDCSENAFLPLPPPRLPPAPPGETLFPRDLRAARNPDRFVMYWMYTDVTNPAVFFFSF